MTIGNLIEEIKKTHLSVFKDGFWLGWSAAKIEATKQIREIQITSPASLYAEEEEKAVNSYKKITCQNISPEK